MWMLARLIHFIWFEQITLGLPVSKPTLMRWLLSCIKEIYSTLHKTFPLKILTLPCCSLSHRIHQGWQDLPRCFEGPGTREKKVRITCHSRILVYNTESDSSSPCNYSHNGRYTVNPSDFFFPHLWHLRSGTSGVSTFASSGCLYWSWPDDSGL